MSRLLRPTGRTAAALVALGAAGALAACGSSTTGGSGDTTPTSAPATSAAPTASASASQAADISGTVTVLAAASLTEAFTTLGDQFKAAHPGVDVKFSFGASSDLAAQITSGAKVDVFASASPKNMKQVVDAGDATSSTNFVSNVMEIAVPPNNPGNVTTVDDLAKSGVKVALCQPQVPCGSVAAQVFKNAKITVKPVTLEVDVKSTLTKVTTGEVDAGVVYVTDVRAAGSKVKGIEIPAAVNASTEYPITVLKNAPNATAAQAFQDYVLSDAGQKVLTDDGFAKP
jgi:molybdate transport system substrate-binding protein